MTDRQITAAFFPNLIPVQRSTETKPWKELFWDMGKKRGLNERQIQSAWDDGNSPKEAGTGVA
jgi:hypothetical protein